MLNWHKFLNDYLKNDGGAFLRSVDGEIAALPVLRALSSAPPAAGPLIAVFPDAARLDRTLEDLKVLAELAGLSPRILVIPEAGRGKLLFPGVESRRARALDAALRGEFDLVIGGCHALLGPAPSPEESRNASLTLVPGMTIAPEELASRLVALDYDDEYEATTTGEFARRGGIIDIYSPAHDFPCRVESIFSFVLFTKNANFFIMHFCKVLATSFYLFCSNNNRRFAEIVGVKPFVVPYFFPRNV